MLRRICGTPAVRSFPALRFQSTSGSEMRNKFIKHHNFSKCDGVDTYVQTRRDELNWNELEQFDGYSETVLRPANPSSLNSATFADHLNHRIPFRDKAFEATYEHYGRAADLLEKLEDDILHPRFHEYIKKAKQCGEDLAAAIDAEYGALHPTFKLYWDLVPVSQFHQLQDWITRVQMRRKDVLQQLSPEYVKTIESLKSTAEMFKERLKKLELAVANDQLVFLDKSQFTEEELLVINQKVTYFRNMRKHGQSWNYGEYHHH